MADTLTNNNIRQYKLLFIFSWVLFYLIFPAWALPVSVTARAGVFFGLMAYFGISAFLMNRWFNVFSVDKPVILPVPSWRKWIKDDLGIVILFCIAAILHIHPISHPILILGDETIHLQGGLLIYDYIDVGWHKTFQAIIWTAVVLALIFKIAADRFRGLFANMAGNKAIKNICVVLFFSFLVFYFFLLKDIPYNGLFIRYPPVSKLLYFLSYSAFGIHRITPRAVQLVFYLLCALYIYRTIKLFHEKETALTGALLYLFLPVTFAYAHLAELANGTIFFIVACSFYFLRSVKDGDNRDLLIAAYLIGAGCLYKKLNLILFIICGIFLIAYKIKKRDFDSLMYLKTLSISLVPIIPWIILTKNFSWRNYVFQPANLLPPHGKIVTYFPMISSNISAGIFVLLVLSVLYVCFFKRSVLTAFFGLLFGVYYFFIVSDMGALSPRFSMAFYPTIIIFLSLFMSRMVRLIKWRHAYKLFFAVLAAYLMVISSVGPYNDRFLNIMNRKLHYYPSEEAMRWVRDNVDEGEKILTIRIMSYNFYRVKYGIDKNRINGFWYDIEKISTPEKLKAYYKKNKMSYIMFPYSPEYPYSRNSAMLQYLKNDRNKEFIKVAAFCRGDNCIYVNKLEDKRKPPLIR